MGDPRPGLHEPGELAIGQVDRVGQHRPFTETAGAVVDVDVVDRFGEEPRDLGDLGAVFRQMGLPVRTGRGGQRG